MNNIHYVYMYTDLDNVPFYVGKGKNDRHRIYYHLHKCHINPFLKNKICKVGIANVQIQFLHKNISEEKAFQQERYWIKYIGRRDKKEGPLCNLTDGGEGIGGYTHSKETKGKIGKALKNRKFSEETLCKMSTARIGRKLPMETCQRMRIAKKGHSVSKETRQKLSAAHRGHLISGETRQKLSIANKGKRMSKVSKQKISEATKGKKNGMYGKTHPIEVRQKISMARKGKKFSKETKQKMRQSQKKRREQEKINKESQNG